MSKKEKIKRYLVFVMGLFISSFGVSFVTKANLGTSPISSIPYVLSLKFAWTLGIFTIAFSCLLIVLQIFILGKKFKLESLLQIPVSIAFGLFIDFSMNLLKWLEPDHYGTKIVSLLIGCIILGFGVYAEVIADVVMLPGESFVRAVTIRFLTEFGITKVCFDASMTVIAGVISFIYFGKLNGVGVGTVIAAILVGFIAKGFGRLLKKIPDILFGKQKETIAENEEIAEHPLVITIAEEYGCNEEQIGK